MPDFGELNPTWLQVTPQFFTQSMESGARLGLERSAQQLRAQESADRFRLAYDQMAEDDQRKNLELQSKMALAQQAMDLKEQGLENQRLRIEDQSRYQSGYLQNLAEKLGLQDQWKQAQLALDQEKANRIKDSIHYGPRNSVIQTMPDGTVKVLRSADPVEPTIEIPLDPNNPFGEKMRGPVEATRKKADELRSQTPGEPAPESGPGLWQNIKDLFWASKTGLLTPSSAAPTPASTKAATTVRKADEVKVIRKSDGKAGTMPRDEYEAQKDLYTLR